MDTNINIKRHKIISFYLDNLNNEVVKYQKKVFDFLNIPLEQVKFSGTHGSAIKKYLDNNDDWDIITIFDVDCIPLSLKPFDEIKKYVNDETIYGNAQISNSTPYCAPSFISFTKSLYKNSLHKSFEGQFYPNELGVSVEADCGEVFTKENLKQGKNIILSYPVKIIDKKWSYQGNESYPGFDYGNGTTFDNDTFHYFQIRFNEHQQSFINFIKIFLNE